MASFNTDDGRRLLAEKLGRTTQTCSECGFTDTILGSAWRTTVTQHVRHGTAVYRLRCPDCGTHTDVELRIP